MKPNKLRSEYAIKSLYGVIIVSALFLATTIYTLSILMSPAGGFTLQSDADLYLVIVALSAFMYVAAYILCAVFFIMWFRRAYFNLHCLVPKSSLRYSEGWAAGAWFIPIFNLFGPYNIATDLFTKTESLLVDANLTTKKPARHSVKGWWWALWIISALLDQIGSKMQDSFDSDIALAGVSITIIGLLMSIVNGLVAIKMIKTYSEMEELIKQLETGNVAFQLKDGDLLD